MRQPLVAGNWKMNGSRASVTELLDGIKAKADTVTTAEIAVCPPAVFIAEAEARLRGSKIAWGGQDVSVHDSGAFTGECSGPMLADFGCKYVIIGHSERRQYFGETDNTVNRKIQAALRVGLKPVFCIGETEKEREAGQTFSVLDKQVKMGLEKRVPEQLDTLVIAYEPVWAIGTGKTATDDQAQEVHQFIRSLIEKSFGNQLSKSIRILYGGSVKPDNILNLMEMPDIDGALVGGASLSADSFSRIVKFK